MDDHDPGGNGHECRLPPIRLAKGPTWSPPVELAARFMVAAYALDPVRAGKAMQRAIAGDES